MVASLFLLGFLASFGVLRGVARGQQCGVPRVQHQGLIRNGNDTQPGDWPWHAALYHRRGALYEYACGGTLINEEFVLTAAHCLFDKDTGTRFAKRRVRVRLGVHNLDKISANTVKEYTVAEMHTGPGFNRNSFRNDIALLELKETVQFTNYIYPACINSGEPSEGDSGTAVGWGVTEHDVISPVLKKAILPVIDRSDCLESDPDFFANMIHRDMFCAGFQNGTTVCNCDSGGGLFLKKDGAWFLTGIVSFSKRREGATNLCVVDGYGGFTNVARYVSWIQNITEISVGSAVEIRIVQSRVSERKCAEYKEKRSFTREATATVHWIQAERCSANIISERYLLTTRECAEGKEWYKEFTPNYRVEITFALLPDSLDANKRLPPKITIENATTLLQEGTVTDLALIDLGRNYKQLTPYVLCLCTDPQPVSVDSVTQMDFSASNFRNPLLKVRDTGEVVTMNVEFYCSQQFYGGALRAEQLDEYFYRLVAVMYQCPIKFVRLTPFLSWIERIVWGEGN